MEMSIVVPAPLGMEVDMLTVGTPPGPDIIREMRNMSSEPGHVLWEAFQDLEHAYMRTLETTDFASPEQLATLRAARKASEDALETWRDWVKKQDDI
jgi:orotidine-5'-phosphate decarboxylase